MMHLSIAICSELSNPAFGTVTLSGRTLNSTATYTCNSGYNLVGIPTRTCEELNFATADWSGTAPICERTYEHGGNFQLSIPVTVYVSQLLGLELLQLLVTSPSN